MSESGPNEDRDSALGTFAQARDGYAAAYQPVPDEALAFVPQGEDYTLGGLVVHVTDVLEHYMRVLDAMLGAGFGQVRVVDPEEGRAEMDALIRDGYPPAQRAQKLDEMRTAHDGLAAKVAALSQVEFTRKAPVLYGPEAAEPYETSAADILGWLTDHYQEHITQAGDLLTAWKATRS
jgi:hypothetical protein